MNYEERALKVGEDCLAVGTALAEYGERVRRRVAALRIINVVVSMAVFVTLVPAFSATIGTIGVSTVSVVAGIVLLLDTLIPLFVGRDNPERYEDYSKYILGYKDSLDRTLEEGKLPPDVREARLNEMVALAQENMRDVKSKWPKLVRTALAHVQHPLRL